MIDVGDVVECIFDDWYPDPRDHGVVPPKKGSHYRVTDVGLNGVIEMLTLRELDPENRWSAFAFRKLEKGSDIFGLVEKVPEHV